MDIHLLWILICKMYHLRGNQDANDFYKDPFFNPMMQYEQAYCYYRYLCMQMDYKIKCKEYEKLCENTKNQNSSNNRA